MMPLKSTGTMPESVHVQTGCSLGITADGRSGCEDPDKRILPPGSAIPPERMEMIDITTGAQIRRVDAVSRHSGCQQLLPVGFGQIDMRPSVLSEVGGHFRSDFITALADT